MIKANDKTLTETILMKYSAMFMMQMIGKVGCDQDTERVSKNAIRRAKIFIAELNKELEPIKTK